MVDWDDVDETYKNRGGREQFYRDLELGIAIPIKHSMFSASTSYEPEYTVDYPTHYQRVEAGPKKYTTKCPFCGTPNVVDEDKAETLNCRKCGGPLLEDEDE